MEPAAMRQLALSQEYGEEITEAKAKEVEAEVEVEAKVTDPAQIPNKRK